MRKLTYSIILYYLTIPLLLQSEVYESIKINNNSISEQKFEIVNGKFNRSYKVYSQSFFNSLKDFELHEINYSGSYWSQYEYQLRSFIPSQIQHYENIGFGTFSLVTAGGYSAGELVLGKSLSKELIDQIQEFPLLSFEGSAISLNVSPQNGKIQGTIGNYLIESDPKTFDGKFKSSVYKMLPDNSKKVVGHIMLNIYGEKDLEMAGGMVLWGENGEANSELIFLKRN